MTRRSLWGVVALALLCSVLGIGSAEAKPNTVTIQAGAIHPTNRNAPYEYMQYYPSTVRIHTGQVVRWNILGFHTVTYSRTGQDGYFRTDEYPQTYGFPEHAIFGSGCGRGSPCVVGAKTRFAGSSAPLFDESPVAFRFDVPPGTYTYFCQIHPDMKGTIEVVGAGEAVPTQKQIDTQIKAAVLSDTKAADALFKTDQKPTSSVGEGGVRTWHVHLGDTTAGNHVAILAFMPGSLDIAAGDRVHYMFRPGSLGEPHTVTFPTEASGGFVDPGIPVGLGGNAFGFYCDPDDPQSGAPGAPVFPGPTGPPECPANLELLWGPWMTQGHPAPGNQVLTPATYHDSGVLLSAASPSKFRTLPDTGRKLPSTFVADFPAPGSFVYECNVHVDLMTASVNVS